MKPIKWIGELTAEQILKLRENPVQLDPLISKLFFESESHDVLMDSLQSDTIAHTDGGMAQLLTPDGRRDRVVTQWYAIHWCKDHRDWTWEAL